MNRSITKLNRSDISMCRLALINQKGINYLRKNYDLLNFLDYLEASFGGHGNGFAIVTKDKEIIFDKGVKLDNMDIVEAIEKNYKNIDWFFYHTRLASKGKISNSNCHPFIYQNKILAMNGTEQVRISGRITDTETIFNFLNHFMVDLADGTKIFNSVFIGYNGEQVFANRNKGSLQYLHIPNSKNIFIFASEFSNEFYKGKNKVYNMPDTWIEGEKINVKDLKISQLKKKNNIVNSYGNIYKYGDLEWIY